MMGKVTTGTIDKDPDRHVLDGTHLNWLIAAYMEDRRLRVDEAATMTFDRPKLRYFTEWWEQEGPKREWLISQNDFVIFEKYVREVISERTKQPLAYNTRNDILRRLRQALHWAYRSGHVERDYSSWLPAPHGGPPKRKAATMPMLEQLLKAAGQSYAAGRDRAIIAVLVGMGLRRGEAANLNVKDLHFESNNSGWADITGKRTRAKLDGKREAAFDAATGSIIAEYLVTYNLRRGPLFRGEEGHRLTPAGLYKVVKRLIEAAGLEDCIAGPHDLRRAFATEMARDAQGSSSARLLSEQLGHTSFAMTSAYILPSIDDVRRNLVSPISKIRASVDPTPVNEIGTICQPPTHLTETQIKPNLQAMAQPVDRAALLERLLGGKSS